MGEEDGRRLCPRPHESDDAHSNVNEPSPLNERSSTGYLDGLRGLAAVIVFIHHWTSDFTEGWHEFGFGQEGHYHFASLPFINILWHGGNPAVVIFFVLSGYVLSLGHLQKLRQQKSTQWSLLSAVLRRPVRLYAPCVAVTLLYAFLLHVPGLILPVEELPLQDNLFAEIWVALTRSAEYLNPFQEHENNLWWFPYNMVMWTIPVELKGSMLIFVILGLYSLIAPGSRRGRALIPTALLFVAAAISLQLALKWSMADFVFGFVLAVNDVWKLDARLLQTTSPANRSFALHTIFFAGWYLLAMPHRPSHIEYATKTPGYMTLGKLIPKAYDESIYYRYWQSWGALLFVYGVLRLEWIQRCFSGKTMRFLGKVSFALYLSHLVFQKTVGHRLMALVGGKVVSPLVGTRWDYAWWIPDIGPMGLSTRFLVCVGIVLPPNLLLSKYLTAFIDEPIVKLAKKMTARLGDSKMNSLRGSIEGEPMLPIARRRRNSL
ncbi:unnamed protein product [Zymoseptoria tritici ST99CH_3D1]|nr:unnamed protein product [Zymoseptoria tritici ST99CH_3D1]